MALSAQYKDILDKAIQAIHARTFFAQYPEHPKAYGEDAATQGLEKYNSYLQHQFTFTRTQYKIQRIIYSNGRYC